MAVLDRPNRPPPRQRLGLSVSCGSWCAARQSLRTQGAARSQRYLRLGAISVSVTRPLPP